MGCCGKQRALIRNSISTVETTGSISGPIGPDIPVEFTPHTAVNVRGPVTHRAYRFDATDPTQWMDPKDAAELLRTGYFRRV